jgi:hypothetical protein
MYYWPTIGDYAGGIAGDGSARRDIAGDDAAGTDYGIVPNTHPRKQDDGAADPGIAADIDWTPELQSSPARRRIARVVGGIDLHRGTNLRPIANDDRNHIENDAIETEEDVRSNSDVVAVIAVKGLPDNGAVANFGKPFSEDHPRLCCTRQGRVVSRQPSGRGGPISDQLRRIGVIQLAGQHLVFFAASHDRFYPSAPASRSAAIFTAE